MLQMRSTGRAKPSVSTRWCSLKHSCLMSGTQYPERQVSYKQQVITSFRASIVVVCADLVKETYSYAAKQFGVVG